MEANRHTGIVPAEVFDTKTRSKGVSIGVMVSFAFNTLIGQVTPIAMDSIGWKFYLLFVRILLSRSLESLLTMWN